MMKHSIKRQMITVFIGLLASMVLLLLIINVSFLEPYYISNKETQFIDMYEKLIMHHPRYSISNFLS